MVSLSAFDLYNFSSLQLAFVCNVYHRQFCSTWITLLAGDSKVWLIHLPHQVHEPAINILARSANPQTETGYAHSVSKAAIFHHQKPKCLLAESLTKTDASTIRRPVVPLTRKSGLTTPHPASRPDIEAEPTPCKNGDATECKKSSRSPSSCTSSVGTTVPNTEFLKAGAEYNERALRIPSRKIATSTGFDKKPKSIIG